jgi:hypothetical protein
MKRYSIIAGIALALLATACNQKEAAYRGLEKVSYSPTDEIFANPERGLYSGGSYASESSRALSQGVLKSARTAGRTLYMLEFWLKPFFESDISEGYLNLIRQSLEAYRGTGVKCILRFGYSDYIRDLSHPEDDAPFDATEEQVLRHIAQIKPILQEYSDVIYVMQAGFIGCWGEWYYTTNFNMNPQSPEDFLPRKHVVDALLDALPGNRQIELRTPRFKMKMYGWSLADTISRAEAHTPTTKARLAGHNDCYLAGADDQGTFRGQEERAYWNAETKYTIMGGETCAMSKYCECPNTLDNLAKQHFSYLNQSYNRTVINYWIKNECYDELKERLGYRLVLSEADITKKPAAGSPLRVVLLIRNDGFASIMNPRDAELVLTGPDGKVVKTWPLNSDPRYWMGGETTVVDQTVELPSGLSGEYTICLNLPDPDYRDNPLYSIRLANKDVWDEETGFNKLHTITL